MHLYNLRGNAHRLLNKTAELHDFLKRHGILIVTITETQLIHTDKVFLQSFTLQHRRDRALHPLQSRNNHQPPGVERPSQDKAIAIQTTIKGKQCTIVSMYAPPGKSIEPRNLTALSKHTTSVLILGDLNAKHPAWNCQGVTPNGRTLFRHQEHSWCVHHTTLLVTQMWQTSLQTYLT
ncbi:hypothetical protein PR048_003237 [Dryococelus australis]|uniref:Endonuclease/exonuclease/phosphatase domain-containing protein n=1 Tax=Dryococelus australis TaxID=614101 RepID=A0ABQ9INZ3_9NEOP|nr:hypothetical protein PR048_003237 [Dryococelus australis]